MSTPAQVVANIANAQASTGPRTEEGKQRSSLNALKHGLTASTVLIPGEDPAEYQNFKHDLTEYWDPKGAGEVEFVAELISVQWRLKRAERLEAVILSAEAPDFKALNNISLHAARLKRQFSVTLKEYDLLHTARLQRLREEMVQAELIRRADMAENRATDFSQFGFDFTADQIDQSIRRQDRLNDVARLLRHGGARRAA